MAALPNMLGFLLPLLIGKVEAKVSCGGHSADSCGECPAGQGAGWCNGECVWREEGCAAKAPNQASLGLQNVSCGGHSASSCAQCSQGHGKQWCNGECRWVEAACVMKTHRPSSAAPRVLISAARESVALLEEILRPSTTGEAKNLQEACAELAAQNTSRAHGTLALLFLFGVPDEAGRLSFPYGIPRNLDMALTYILEGLGPKCSLCYTLLGFLTSMGHPASMVAAAQLQQGRETDLAALAYRAGSNLGDVLSNMAFASSRLHGLIAADLMLDSVRPSNSSGSSSSSSVHSNNLSLWRRRFVGAAEGAKCLTALDDTTQAVVRSIQNCEDDQHKDWEQRPLHDQRPLEQKKEWADWVLNRASTDASWRYRYAKLLFQGTDSVPRNTTKAAEQYRRSVSAGHPGGHWNLFLMQMRGEVAESDEHIKAILNDKVSFQPVHAAMAESWAHRRGLVGRPKDAKKAGEWLEHAAMQGDRNAQVFMAKGLRGEHDPVLAGIYFGQRNEEKARTFYEMAASQGSIGSSFMVTYLNLDRDKGCVHAYKEWRQLAAKCDPVASTLYAHALRSYEKGDHVGAALRLLLLSEAGSQTAMEGAAELLPTLASANIQDEFAWACGGLGWLGCAVQLRERLVLLGHTRSLSVLATMLRAGWQKSGKEDLVRAKHLTRLAAERGEPRGLWDAAWDELCEGNDPRQARDLLEELQVVISRDGVGPFATLFVSVAMQLSHIPSVACWASEFQFPGGSRLLGVTLFIALIIGHGFRPSWSRTCESGALESRNIAPSTSTRADGRVDGSGACGVSTEAPTVWT